MLTQKEANRLVAMDKSFLSQSAVSMQSGKGVLRELENAGLSEQFLLDMHRGRMRFSKITNQVRARKCIVLVRLDIDAAPHTNPNGSKIGGTHIHLYREGYEDKWAELVSPRDFRDLSNFAKIFEDFCKYCNILNPPPFKAQPIQLTLV